MKREIFEDALTEIREDYILEAAMAKKPVRKRVGILLMAAILFALTLAVNAAAPVGLDFYLRAVFGDGYTMLDEMTAMPEHVAYRASGDELRLELNGIVGDSQVVYVFADITVAAEHVPPEGSIYSIAARIEPMGFAWNRDGSHSASSFGMEPILHEDGSATYPTVFKLTSGGGVLRGKYVISCTGVRIWDMEKKEHIPICEGRWNLAFTLNYPDLTVREAVSAEGVIALESFENPDETVELPPVQVYEICRSPVSVGIYFTTTPDFNEKLGTGLTKEATLRFDDGTALYWKDRSAENFVSGADISCSSEGGDAKGCILLTFDEPIDADTLASITVGGLTIPLK